MPEFNFVIPSTRFKCTRCAQCCSLDVMLSRIELEQLGRDADPKWKTTRKVMGKSGPVCCLLDSNICTIYASRPKLCRVYPFFAIPIAELELFHIVIPDDAVRVKAKDGDMYVIIYDDRCPGTSCDPGITGSAGGDHCNCQDVVSLTLEHLGEFEAKK